MSTWLIAAMGVVYFVVACDQFYKGGIGTGIMFLGYALGNVGLVMVAKQYGKDQSRLNLVMKQ